MENVIAQTIIAAFKKGNKVLICGNGGSAAESQHFAAELMGRFEHDRRALPALALTTDTSILTAVSNDYDFVNVFSRQIEALGKKGDVLIILSTSGSSFNCLEAEDMAREKKMDVIWFPSNSQLGTKTYKTQEEHLRLIHAVCRIVEEAFLEN